MVVWGWCGGEEEEVRRSEEEEFGVMGRNEKGIWTRPGTLYLLPGQ